MIQQEPFFSWLDGLLSRQLPADTAALCLNLYEDGQDAWSAELIGTDCFDPEDSDWACNEIFTFREALFQFRHQGGWEAALAAAVSVLTAYLKQGSRAAVMKSCQAVAVGFVDGDLQIAYTAPNLQL